MTARSIVTTQPMLEQCGPNEHRPTLRQRPRSETRRRNLKAGLLGVFLALLVASPAAAGQYWYYSSNASAGSWKTSASRPYVTGGRVQLPYAGEPLYNVYGQTRWASNGYLAYSAAGTLDINYSHPVKNNAYSRCKWSVGAPNQVSSPLHMTCRMYFN